MSNRSSQLREQIRDPALIAPETPAIETRIDPPHPLRTDSAQADIAAREVVSDEVPAEQGVEPEVGSVVDWQDAAEELRRQAVDLQRLLAQRMADLDRREAAVNAHAAELENQSRAVRLWLREQHDALDLREAELTAREVAVVERASAISAAEAYHEQSRQAIDRQIAALQQEQATREGQLSALKQRMDAERAALEEGNLRLRSERDQLERERTRALQEIEQRRASAAEMTRMLMQGVERRRRAIEKLAAERATADHQVTARAAEQKKLAIRERKFLERVRTTRSRLLEKARRWAAQLRRKDEQLRRQREQLLARRVELERLHAEVMNRRRELLELRSHVEHLLAELTARGKQGPLMKSLAATRTALASHYQDSREALSRQQQVLEDLRSEVAARYSQLVHQREEIINLARRRRQMEAHREPQSAARRADPGVA